MYIYNGIKCRIDQSLLYKNYAYVFIIYGHDIDLFLAI